MKIQAKGETSDSADFLGSYLFKPEKENKMNVHPTEIRMQATEEQNQECYFEVKFIFLLICRNEHFFFFL